MILDSVYYIRRHLYLEKLRRSLGNGKIKVLTGMRGCGKSYVLCVDFCRELAGRGFRVVNLEHEERLRSYPSADLLERHLRESCSTPGPLAVLLDHYDQISSPCAEEPSSLDRLLVQAAVQRQAEVFLTLSCEAGRDGCYLEHLCEPQLICFYPLAFSELLGSGRGRPQQLWESYLEWGGLPGLLGKAGRLDPQRFLLRKLDDALSRIEAGGHVQSRERLNGTLVQIARNLGRATSPYELRNGTPLKSSSMVGKYLHLLEEGFLLTKLPRLDRRQVELSHTTTFYFGDIGLLKAALQFTAQPEALLQRHALLLELLCRDYKVYTAQSHTHEIDGRGVKIRKVHTIDFFCLRGSEEPLALQCAFAATQDGLGELHLALRKLKCQASRLMLLPGDEPPHTDERGIVSMGLFTFIKQLKLPD
ncbi:MAG: ATP-binding protein [Succinivibrio sp.]|nr:ATP-binding protein [Succinivibrio sp.]